MKHNVNKIAWIVGALGLIGCTATNEFFQGEPIDYQSASKNQSKRSTLDVPPDLTQLPKNNRFALPGQPATEPVTALDFQKKAALQNHPSTVLASISPDTADSMHIERDGSARWLVVKMSPEVLWPKIKTFWEANGFTIHEASETTGIMETDWAENRAKIPQDFIRKTLGSVFDGLYSTGERDKFRTRLERGSDGTTDIYITHRGAEEVLVGRDKSSTTWTTRPSDPALEAAFLTRLMLSLGATEPKAQELITHPVTTPAKAWIISEGQLLSLQVGEGFDRAWRRVGHALDRLGFTVEDRNRSEGIYFVRYVNQDEEANKPGFFSRLWGKEDKTHAKNYRINVKSKGEGAQVTVQNKEGQLESSESAKKILLLLLDQLK